MDLDFEGLGRELLNQGESLLSQWLPGGKRKGKEWVCGNLNGGSGDSLKVNLETGKWAEFAGTEAGGDLISLYAAIKNIKQGEAFKELGGQKSRTTTPPRELKATEPVIRIGKPPIGTKEPPLIGSFAWKYVDCYGETIFYVTRHNLLDGKKSFTPYCWDFDAGKWVNKAFPVPRPLYGLDLLAQRPEAPVLVVEGEKTADAARTLLGKHYVVVCWPNGSLSVDKTDLSPLAERRLVLWPDADVPGRSAMEKLASLAKTDQIRIIDTAGQPDGWDLADALAEGWDEAKTIVWAKPRAKSWGPVEAKVQEAQIVDLRPEITINLNFGDLDGGAEPTQSMRGLWEALGLTMTNAGQPIANSDNVLRILERKENLKNLVWFDDFHSRFFTNWKTHGTPREWTDNDDISLMIYLQRKLGISRASDDMINKAIRELGLRNRRNEPRDWMDSLKWDGKERIEKFFVDKLGTEDTAYTRAVGANFFIGMVARVFRPGCQLDHMVILEGKQNAGKTSSLRILGGQWYAESAANVMDKDFFMTLQGKIIIEIAELDAFNRAEVNRIKQVITCPSDRYRAPFARTSMDHLRTSIFVGTTNETNYLRDNTGARRFWPILCGEINLPAIKDDREQLFAEAVHWFKGGLPWHKVPLDETLMVQEDRRQSDEWEYIISEFLAEKPSSTLHEIAVGALKIETGRLDYSNQKRIVSILRMQGWKSRRTRIKGVLMRLWEKTTFLDVGDFVQE